MKSKKKDKIFRLVDQLFLLDTFGDPYLEIDLNQVISDKDFGLDKAKEILAEISPNVRVKVDPIRWSIFGPSNNSFSDRVLCENLYYWKMHTRYQNRDFRIF